MCFNENMTPLDISMDNQIRNSYLKGNLVCGFCFRSYCGCISQTCNNPLAQNSHKWTSSKAECTCDIKPSRMTTVHEQLWYCWKCALRQQICCRFENNLKKTGSDMNQNEGRRCYGSVLDTRVIHTAKSPIILKVRIRMAQTSLCRLLCLSGKILMKR